jgi:hypothetical protein
LDLKQRLVNCNFEHWGEVVITDGLVRFCPRTTVKDRRTGFTYVWAERNKAGLLVDPLYIGKAGKTLSKRFRDHQGGFDGGSTSGVRLATNIKASVAAGSQILVWVRHAEIIPVLGQPISFCHIEEPALILAWKPLWNTQV